MLQREHGLLADLPTEEIVMIAKTASDATYANVEFGKRTFAELGYAPPTRSVLEDSVILSSTLSEVQADRTKILSSRIKRQGIPANSSSVRVAPNEIYLGSVGLGLQKRLQC